MLGGYMILAERVDVYGIEAAFAFLAELFVPYTGPTEVDTSITVFDCWKAMRRANSLGWLDLSSDRELREDELGSQMKSPMLDMEECTHYSNPLNGSLHFVIPGRLLHIPSPTDLPDGLQWLDAHGARSFSPSFYADLLAEFNVVLVICLVECDYDRGPFTQSGMGVEELCLRPDSPDILRAADRFLSLMAAAPGAVAIHGGCGGAGLRYAGTLVSAHMMSRLGFGAGDAAAWLRMACPALLVPPEYLAALQQDEAARGAAAAADANDDAAAASLLLRCFSHDSAAAGHAAAAAAATAREQLGLQRAFSLPDVIL